MQKWTLNRSVHVIGCLELLAIPALYVRLAIMNRCDFLDRRELTSLKINLDFLEGEFQPLDPDPAAAWELYVELLTRVSTQSLAPEDGDEKTPLV